MKAKKRMVIIASYFAGETYGLLGPQMAVTIIRENTPYDCIVIAVAREDDKALLNKALADYFAMERPIIGFSTLSGRKDLFSLAKELKAEGSLTILAAPQANVDYLGEKIGRIIPTDSAVSQRISPSLCTGRQSRLNVETNLQAIHLMRQLKEEFPQVWGYSRGEGANHGFIHPTPWDTGETSANIQRVLSLYTLPPLISSLNIVSLSSSTTPQDWGIGSERSRGEKGCSLKDMVRSSAGGRRGNVENPEDFFLTTHKQDIIDTTNFRRSVN